MAVKNSKSKAPYRAKVVAEPTPTAPEGWAAAQWRAALEAGPKATSTFPAGGPGWGQEAWGEAQRQPIQTSWEPLPEPMPAPMPVEPQAMAGYTPSRAEWALPYAGMVQSQYPEIYPGWQAMQPIMEALSEGKGKKKSPPIEYMLPFFMLWMMILSSKR